MYSYIKPVANKSMKRWPYQFSYKTRKAAATLLLLACLTWIFVSRCGDHFSLDTASVASGKSVRNKPRIAIVSFVTSQQSYMHLSLRNKARE